jgi:hypothetical protein
MFKNSDFSFEAAPHHGVVQCTAVLEFLNNIGGLGTE